MFGTIELMSETHPLNARGQIQRDGTFVLGTYEDDDGAIAGEHKVIIAQLFMSPIEMNIEHDHGDLVDEKYASYETSGLTCTITTRGSDNELILTVNKRN